MRNEKRRWEELATCFVSRRAVGTGASIITAAPCNMLLQAAVRTRLSTVLKYLHTS